MVLLEDFWNAKGFLIRGRIVLLSRSKLARETGNRLVVLVNDGTKLQIRSISLNDKRCIEIWISQQGFGCDHRFDSINGSSMSQGPMRLEQIVQNLSQRRKGAML